MIVSCSGMFRFFRAQNYEKNRQVVPVYGREWNDIARFGGCGIASLCKKKV